MAVGLGTGTSVDFNSNRRSGTNRDFRNIHVNPQLSRASSFMWNHRFTSHNMASKTPAIASGLRHIPQKHAVRLLSRERWLQFATDHL